MTIGDDIIAMCMESAKISFDRDVMTCDRLMTLLSSPYTTHFLMFMEGKKRVGLVMFFSDESVFLQYHFSFFIRHQLYPNMGFI